MSAAKALPKFEAFGVYVDPFGASRSALSFWLDSWRAGIDAAMWWNQHWLDTVAAFAPASSRAPAAAPTPSRPIAAVIDLAEVAAQRTAAEFGDAAAAAVEAAETVADASASIAEDAASVAEHAVVVATPSPDDLTRLVGIGPKLSVALAERGVTRFAQIAQWTEADLAEIDKALDLKGRAVRDAWVAQAKRFAAEA